MISYLLHLVEHFIYFLGLLPSAVVLARISARKALQDRVTLPDAFIGLFGAFFWPITMSVVGILMVANIGYTPPISRRSYEEIQASLAELETQNQNIERQLGIGED